MSFCSPPAGEDLSSVAVKVVAMEAFLLATTTTSSNHRRSEARAAFIGALAEALLDGSTPLMAVPLLQAMYHRVSTGPAVLDSAAKVCTWVLGFGVVMGSDSAARIMHMGFRVFMVGNTASEVCTAMARFSVECLQPLL